MRMIFQTIRRLVFPTLLVVSILFNGLLLVSSTVFAAASAAIGAVTGFVHPYTRTADDLASLKVDLNEQKQLNRKLRSEAADLSAQVATSRAAQVKAKATVAKVSRRVTERTTKAAVRDTAAMGAESIPVWGIAVIVAATAAEVYDLCQTAIDMNELQEFFDPSLAVPEEELTVCGMEVPSRAELWETASNAPGNAWASVREVMPTVEDVSDFELPNLDWTEFTTVVTDSAESIASGSADAVGGKWDQLKAWWAK